MARTTFMLGTILTGALACQVVGAADPLPVPPPPRGPGSERGGAPAIPPEPSPARPEEEAAPSSGNPYQKIIDRNVFHLNPPPKPPDPEVAKPPPPKIFLTGISTLRGVRKALLKTAPVAKHGEAPKELAYVLTEHETKDALEVLSIDEVEGSVKLRYEGELITVNFKDNSVATTAAAPPPPGAIPGQLPGLVPPPPPASGPSGFTAPPGRAGAMIPGAFQPQFPQRPVREAHAAE